MQFKFRLGIERHHSGKEFGLSKFPISLYLIVHTFKNTKQSDTSSIQKMKKWCNEWTPDAVSPGLALVVLKETVQGRLQSRTVMVYSHRACNFVLTRVFFFFTVGSLLKEMGRKCFPNTIVFLLIHFFINFAVISRQFSKRQGNAHEELSSYRWYIYLEHAQINFSTTQFSSELSERLDHKNMCLLEIQEHEPWYTFKIPLLQSFLH